MSHANKRSSETGRILMEPKKSILIIHYDLHIPDGVNAVVAWMLEALKKEYDITMLTWKPVDVAAYNRYLGTSLHPTDFKNDNVPKASPGILKYSDAVFDLERLTFRVTV